MIWWAFVLEPSVCAVSGEGAGVLLTKIVQPPLGVHTRVRAHTHRAESGGWWVYFGLYRPPHSHLRRFGNVAMAELLCHGPLLHIAYPLYASFSQRRTVII